MCIPPLVDEKLEQDRATVDKVFEELSSHDNKIDKELFQQKVSSAVSVLANKRFISVFDKDQVSKHVTHLNFMCNKKVSTKKNLSNKRFIVFQVCPARHSRWPSASLSQELLDSSTENYKTVAFSTCRRLSMRL